MLRRERGCIVPVGDTQQLWMETRDRGRPVVLLADTGFDPRVWQTAADRMASDVALTTWTLPAGAARMPPLTPDHWPTPRRPASVAGR
jgi:hypothetical protein